jgi:predicted PolB exonuclease-like 3'-5' exonuclease
MSRQRVVVFDLETIPDLTTGRELIQAAPDVADEQVRRTLGERYARAGEDPSIAFVKTPLQKIVCVGAIYAEREDHAPASCTSRRGPSASWFNRSSKV